MTRICAGICWGAISGASVAVCVFGDGWQVWAGAALGVLLGAWYAISSEDLPRS